MSSHFRAYSIRLTPKVTAGVGYVQCSNMTKTALEQSHQQVNTHMKCCAVLGYLFTNLLKADDPQCRSYQNTQAWDAGRTTYVRAIDA